MKQPRLNIASLRVTLLILCFLFNTDAYAEPEPEPWYFGFQLGTGSLRFAGKDGSNMRALDSEQNLEKTSLGGSIFVYWPVGSSTLLGISESFLVTLYQRPDGGLEGSSTYSQHSIAMSILHSFGPNRARGLYVKGDIGPGFSIRFENSVTGQADGGPGDISYGLFLNTGVGYAFGITDGTVLLASGEIGVCTGAKSALQYTLAAGFLF